MATLGSPRRTLPSKQQLTAQDLLAPLESHILRHKAPPTCEQGKVSKPEFREVIKPTVSISTKAAFCAKHAGICPV